MNRLAIDPVQAAAEAADFSNRFAAGARALAALDLPREGCSARDAVHREDRVILYRYQPQARSAGLPPILICYALVNRPYMMDLQPDRSLIRGLLARGLDVYLVDWGYPEAADRYLELDDYVTADVTIKLGDRELNKLNEVRFKVEKQLALADGVAEDFGKIMNGAKAGDERTVDITLSQELGVEALRAPHEPAIRGSANPRVALNLHRCPRNR